MKPGKFIATILFLLVTTTAAWAQDFSLYQKKYHVSGTDSLPYRMLLPKNYDPAKTYPLVFVMHGAGERGNNNEAQLTHGGKLFLQEEVRNNYPAIVVFPQCARTSFWSNVSFQQDASNKRSFAFKVGRAPTLSMKLAQELLYHLLKAFKVKKDQVYVMGLSMGGMGTFELAYRNPTLIAAAVPICGGAHPETAPAIKYIKWWVFHGAKDDVVPPANSDIMVDALKKAGASVQYTRYPDANHNSWDAAFAEKDLLPWLFSVKRK